jgi:hypothetical protein
MTIAYELGWQLMLIFQTLISDKVDIRVISSENASPARTEKSLNIKERLTMRDFLFALSCAWLRWG